MTWIADRPSARGRLKRRAYPIAAYVGPNGTGKSAVMVYDTLPSLDYGRPVLSTVRLLDFRNPRPCPGGDVCDDPSGHDIKRNRAVIDPDEPTGLRIEVEDTGQVHQAAHPLYVRFTDYAQLLNWRDGDVLMDEVTGVASSREVSSMPVQVANFLVQLRRRNIALRWSAPSWGRADKIIREVTQGVVLCSAMLPKRAKVGPDEPPRLWTEKRLFIARTYDPTSMEEFEAHRADNIPHEGWSMYWRPGSFMERAYDTYDSVTALGWANDAGLCMVCGGRRSHPSCGCEEHRSRRRGPRPAERAGVPAASPPPALPPAAPRQLVSSSTVLDGVAPRQL